MVSYSHTCFLIKPMFMDSRLLNEGAYVALCGRDIEALDEIGKQFPAQALVIQCDLGVDIQQYVIYYSYNAYKT